MPKTWDKFGLKWALEDYDQQFSMHKNAYRDSAELALWLEPIIKGECIIDLGSGTGISTVAMLNSNPEVRSIICIEPAEAIKVAKHKFGHETLFDADDPAEIEKKLGVRLSREYVTHLKKIRESMLKFREKVSFINAPAQEISDLVMNGKIIPESVQKIYCMSSFHWLANNEESGRTSPGFVADSLKGFYITLAPGGLLVFNESGLQFNYGMERIGNEGKSYKGMLANDVHMLQQEFHRRFIRELNAVFKEKGFSDKALFDENGKADTYHFIFDMYNLTKILEGSGFKLKKLDKRKAYHAPEAGMESISYVPGHKNYLFTIMPKEASDWERVIVTGGNMRYFNHADELKVLPSKERKDLLNEAYSRAVNRYSSLMNIPFGETFATFVAVKR